MDFVKDIFYVKNTIFEKMEKYIKNETDLKIKYDFKLVKDSLASTYPQAVFKENRNTTSNATSRNELRKRNLEYEIAVYAKQVVIGDEIFSAECVAEEIVNVLVYYLQKINKFNNVNVVSRAKNFDSKNVESQRIVLQFEVTWLQDLNIIK